MDTTSFSTQPSQDEPPFDSSNLPRFQELTINPGSFVLSSTSGTSSLGQAVVSEDVKQTGSTLGSTDVGADANTSSNAELPKPPHKAALEEILQQQPNEPPFLIGPLAFTRVVKGISTEVAPGIMWESSAVQALQEGVEAYMVGFFEDVNMVAMRNNRVTIIPEDIQFTRKIRNL